jgi:hypothetical protein
MRNWEHNTRISEEVKDWKHSTISVDQRERFYSFGLLNCLSSCVEVAVGEKYNVQIGWLRENTSVAGFGEIVRSFANPHHSFPMES